MLLNPGHAVGQGRRLIAPHVSDQCLNERLLLELNYLKQDLTSNAGDRSDKALIHNAYAVLTACRILYSARHRTLISKGQATDGRWRPSRLLAADHSYGAR